MSYSVKQIEVWAADIVNQPGTLARLLEALAQAGAQLEFVIARKVSENTSRAFVSPLKGKKQKQAAADAGMVPATGMHALRVEGPDRPGLAGEVARAIAAAGINIRGVAGAVMGKKAAINVAFENAEDAPKAAKAIKKALATKKRK